MAERFRELKDEDPIGLYHLYLSSGRATGVPYTPSRSREEKWRTLRGDAFASTQERARNYSDYEPKRSRKVAVRVTKDDEAAELEGRS